MRRVKTSIIILVLAAMPSAAQNIDPILKFLGADSAEQISPYDLENLEELLEHSIRLNHASESKLEESGLMSHYQAASLSDYRARHGDILSFNELAAVDGFGKAFVEKLAPFVSLDSNRLPGSTARNSIRNDISIRSSIRTAGSATYSLKYKIVAGERLTGGISISRTSASPSPAPDAYSGHIAYHFSSRAAKILIGDFNARFGQGLAIWNGMSFSGLTSASSFLKRPSGISASSSFTGGYAMRGLAGDIRLGRTRISAMTAVAQTKEYFSILPAVNASLFMKNGLLSLTHYADFALTEGPARIPDMKTSADMAFTIRGIDIFAEAAFDWVTAEPAALAGISTPAGDDVRIAAMLRYYPAGFTSERSAAARSTTKCTNEYAASLATDFSAGGWIPVNGASGFGSSVRRHSGNVSADFAYFPIPKSHDADLKSLQLKAQAEWTYMISSSFRTSLRISERIRTWSEPFRTDIRADLSYISKYLLINLRMNMLHSYGIGLLSYLEGGYRNENIGFYARTGLFRIDNWADRIYVYERDAPGSFNVPAYYGRGVWAALTMNWKFTWWGRIYLRAAMTSYPFMTEKKPGRAELKIQFVFRI